MYNVLVTYYCLKCHFNRRTHMARRHPLHLCEISAHSMFCVSICAYCAPVSAVADCTQTCEDMCTSLVWVSCVVVLGWNLRCIHIWQRHLQCSPRTWKQVDYLDQYNAINSLLGAHLPLAAILFPTSFMRTSSNSLIVITTSALSFSSSSTTVHA